MFRVRVEGGLGFRAWGCLGLRLRDVSGITYV